MGRKGKRQFTYRAEVDDRGKWFGMVVEEPQLMIFDQESEKKALRAIEALHREQMADYARFYKTDKKGVFY